MPKILTMSPDEQLTLSLEELAAEHTPTARRLEILHLLRERFDQLLVGQTTLTTVTALCKVGRT